MAYYPDNFTHEIVQAGALSMHTVIEGDAAAPAIVLLHGFPEFWYSWRFQIKPLVEAGYQVIVPDMRGYNLTDKAGPYDGVTLVTDIVHLIDTLGHRTVHLVGHDWGGVVAWLFASLHSDRLKRLVVINLPHPAAFASAFNHFYLPQILKSWYVGFFQIPWLPEFLLSAFNYGGMARLMKLASPTTTDEELAYYRAAWAQPGALTAMLGYYRSLLRQRNALSVAQTVTVPTRLIWGDPDPALSLEVARWSVKWCPGLDLKVIPHTGHFVQQQAHEQVTEYIRGFLQAE